MACVQRFRNEAPGHNPASPSSYNVIRKSRRTSETEEGTRKDLTKNQLDNEKNPDGVTAYDEVLSLRNNFVMTVSNTNVTHGQGPGLPRPEPS